MIYAPIYNLTAAITALLVNSAAYSEPINEPKDGQVSSYYQDLRCNLAKIRSKRGYSDIYKSSNSRSRITYKLNNGKTVYVCNDKDKWLGIRFSIKSGPCLKDYSDGILYYKSRACLRGWIRQRDVDVISG